MTRPFGTFCLSNSSNRIVESTGYLHPRYRRHPSTPRVSLARRRHSVRRRSGREDRRRTGDGSSSSLRHPARGAADQARVTIGYGYKGRADLRHVGVIEASARQHRPFVAQPSVPETAPAASGGTDSRLPERGENGARKHKTTQIEKHDHAVNKQCRRAASRTRRAGMNAQDRTLQKR